jgi:hypothetical protein
MDLVAINGIDNSVSVLMNDSGTSVKLASSQNPSLAGQPVTFTATITPTVNKSLTPGGTVIFRDGFTPLASLTLAGGTAAFTSSSLSSGDHNIQVIYVGDNYFNPNRSAVHVQTVQ